MPTTSAAARTVAGPGRFESITGIADARLGVTRFRNLRYARAGRFSPPTPVAGDRPIQADPSRVLASPQHVDAGSDFNGSYRAMTQTEDCQVLTITRPADLAPGELLPVMVWVHGGSYFSGAGDLSIFNPTALVRQERVIVVSVTYRLGVLGFLGGPDRPANLGLLDLVAALQWVSRNIAEFGGDPSAVTLFGHSSGGDAVAHLLISHGTEGLIRRAIIQSSPWGLRGRRRDLEVRLAMAAGTLDHDTPIDAITSLRPALARQALRDGFRMGMPLAPQYGATPLPPESDALGVWRARTRGVDVMIGWTRDEAAFFLGGLPRPLSRWLVRPGIGSAVRETIVQRATDSIYRHSGAAFARQLGSAVRASYELDWVPPGNVGGAMHAIELPLLFPDPQAWDGADMLGEVDLHDLDRIGAPLRAAWAAFARNGEPPREDLHLDGGGRLHVHAPPSFNDGSEGAERRNLAR